MSTSATVHGVDTCCGCGCDLPYTAEVGKARLIQLWCDECVPDAAVEEERLLFGGSVCPLCNEETENLHPEDGLCPRCERAWVAATSGELR
jgi:hypothetical protein